MTYDSTEDTIAHIETVQANAALFRATLLVQAGTHDASKLRDPEKAAFDIATPKLRGLTYGSPEYKAATAELGDALKHHYAHNRHHPEHHADGIRGMDLVDLVEMLCDWKAASERHADGDIRESLRINAERYDIGPDLYMALANTVDRLWPLQEPEAVSAETEEREVLVGTRTKAELRDFVKRSLNRLAPSVRQRIKWDGDAS